MKKIKTVLAAVLMMSAGIAYAGETDVLINKLAEKGVITNIEAAQIKTETIEEAKKGLAKASVETLPKWLQKLSVSGVIFTDYFYNLTENAAPATIDAFELSRLYLTVKEQVSDRVSIRATLEGAQGTAATNAPWIKYAYFEYSDILPGATFRMGVIQTPWVAYEEDNLWKNRFMAKVMVDNEGKMSSADVGIGLKGHVIGKLIEYDLTAMNGEGYKAPEVAKDKDFAARESISIINGLKLHAFEQVGRSGVANPPAERNRTLLGLSFSQGDVNAAAYSFTGKDASVYSGGYSAYATYKLTPNLSLLARHDFFDPNTNSEVTKDSYHRVIAGLVIPVTHELTVGIDGQTKNFEDPSQGKDQAILYTHVAVNF